MSDDLNDDFKHDKDNSTWKDITATTTTTNNDINGGDNSFCDSNQLTLRSVLVSNHDSPSSSSSSRKEERWLQELERIFRRLIVDRAISISDENWRMNLRRSQSCGSHNNGVAVLVTTLSPCSCHLFDIQSDVKLVKVGRKNKLSVIWNVISLKHKKKLNWEEGVMRAHISWATGHFSIKRNVTWWSNHQKIYICNTHSPSLSNTFWGKIFQLAEMLSN